MQSTLRHRHAAAVGLSGLAVLLFGLATPGLAGAQTARTLYERAGAREAEVRQASPPSADDLRGAARTYENIVRRYPKSGYSDNALWQAAGLVLAAYELSDRTSDRDLAEHYLDWLANEYPHSSLVKQVPEQRRLLAGSPSPASSARPAPPASAPQGTTSVVRRVTRTALPRGDRITIEFSREVRYRGDRVSAPDRLFFDFTATEFPAGMAGDSGSIAGRLVSGVRFGRHENQVTRVVLELSGSPRYSAFPMYDPFRLVIDVESDALPIEDVWPDPVLVLPPPPTPVPPSTTRTGDYSLARQLGLGVSRIVIDAGHGGHDPGAQANGLVEADLVLDLAHRVETILSTQPGFEVVLTRSSNEYIPLEERTAIANREGADLFLSIHANASRRTATRGVEIYVLNFATNSDAAEVAARENSSSAQAMGKLPALLDAIALKSKLDESRELATIVQTSLVRKLRAGDPAVKDLGVKQAPFVVLIGAQMPSILAEVSFITNKAEASLLKQDSYRDRIAHALADGVIKYQASLKKVTTDPLRGGSR